MEDRLDKTLIQQIHEAFPDGRPPKRPVTGHRCTECDETDRLLGGRNWTDVASDFPYYCHDVFPLLTPLAQEYYLPAYMVMALDPNSNMQGISVESALCRLSHCAGPAGLALLLLRWRRDDYRSGLYRQSGMV